MDNKTKETVITEMLDNVFRHIDEFVADGTIQTQGELYAGLVGGVLGSVSPTYSKMFNEVKENLPLTRKG